MPTCSVPYCVNATNKDTHLTFHEFPHETPLFLNKWIENIGRPNWRPGLRSVVCSEHFQKDDFDRKGRLYVGSFPSKFPISPFRKKKKSVQLEPKVSPAKSSSVPFSEPGTPNLVKLPVSKSVQPNSSNAHLHSSDIKDDPAHLISSYTSERDQNTDENFDNFSPNILIKIEENLPSPQASVLEKNVADINNSEDLGHEPMKRRKLVDKSSLELSAVEKVASVSSTFSLLSCRVCGHTSNLNTKIFGEEGKKMGLAEMMKKCLHVEVLESGMLPLSLCNICIPRLKTCSELISTCQKTNDILLGGNSCQSGNEDADPPIIYSEPNKYTQPNSDNRRMLILEMNLVDGISVKDMINQSVQELSLRLKSKESRESKPQGRIMFLDLQGGSEAFPEQIKQAISRLFSRQSQTKSAETSPHPAAPNSSSSVTPQAQPRPASLNQTSPPPLVLKPVAKPVVKPLAPKVSPSNPGQSLVVQTSPVLSAVPVSSFCDNNLLSTPITVATLPVSSHSFTSSTVPRFSVGKLLGLPNQSKCNFVKIHPKPATLIASQVSSSMESHVVEANSEISSHPVSSVTSAKSSTINQDVPPLVPIRDITPLCTKLKEGQITSVPFLDIAKMKDKVITKINNMGNQFKLGDKIVGIVVRNSDSSKDIQKKLQATFAKPSQTKEKAKTVAKSKERTILPKGSTSNPWADMEWIQPMDEVKRPKDGLLDVCPVADSPSVYFERRNARRLSFSFMWRKTGYLVSSYQKLFTWQLMADDSANADPVLTCRVCKFAASSKSEVENHLQAHPDLQCSICSKYFLTVEKVQEHVKVIHHMPVPLETTKRKTYVTWRNNVMKRLPLKQYQCAHCDRRFKVKDALQRHFTVCKEKSLGEKVVAITKKNGFNCSVCNRSFSSDRTLQDHILTHTKRTSWLCDICGTVLSSASNYRSHIARHDEKAHEYKYQCGFCRKRFKLKNRYEDHIKKHEEKRQFVCSSCGKVFHSPSGLRQHEILHGERKLQCRFCPARFHRRDHLRSHEASHNKPQKSGDCGPRFFTCRYCAISTGQHIKFANMRLLMRHYQDEHTAERGTLLGSLKYTCDRCNRSFANSTLLRHHQMWHSGLRPYSCSTCGAGFMVKERLRNHELKHTNERPYKCQTCGKGFRSRTCLKQHKSIHKDPSDYYKCKYCDKGFSRIDNLRTHIRVHTGEKPWKCVHCQKQFRLRSDCTKHIHNVHQVPLEAVPDHIETLIDPSNADSTVQIHTSTGPSDHVVIDPSLDAAVDAAVAGITTVTTMELLIEDDDLEECEESI